MIVGYCIIIALLRHGEPVRRGNIHGMSIPNVRYFWTQITVPAVAVKHPYSVRGGRARGKRDRGLLDSME
jgi:hypothetical protein